LTATVSPTPAADDHFSVSLFPPNKALVATLLILAFSPSIAGAASARYHSSQTQPGSAPLADRTNDDAVILAALNERRSARGLPPLTLDPLLSTIARDHAVDMVSRNYFDHMTPEGESPFQRMDRAHYRYGYAGENIALDQSAPAAADAWWHSSEHRQNMLDVHFVRVGIAAVPSPDGEIFVEDFSD